MTTECQTAQDILRQVSYVRI